MPTSFRFPKMIETVIAAGQAGLQGLNPKSLRETLKDREKMVSSFSKDGGKTVENLCRVPMRSCEGSAREKIDVGSARKTP